MNRKEKKREEQIKEEREERQTVLRTSTCTCGGRLSTMWAPPDGWETSCDNCGRVWDED